MERLKAFEFDKLKTAEALQPFLFEERCDQDLADCILKTAAILQNMEHEAASSAIPKDDLIAHAADLACSGREHYPVFLLLKYCRKDAIAWALGEQG